MYKEIHITYRNWRLGGSEVELRTTYNYNPVYYCVIKLLLMRKRINCCKIVFVCFNFFYMFCFQSISQPLLVDTSLLNNSDNWKVKSGMMTGRTLPKIKFGPFETVEVEKGKKSIVGSDKEKWLTVSSNGGGFGRTITTEKAQPFSLTALFNQTDSIMIDMLMATFTNDKRITFRLGNKEQPDQHYSYSYSEQTIIKSNKFSESWLLPSVNFKQVIDPEFLNGSEQGKLFGFTVTSNKEEYEKAEAEYANFKTILRSENDSFEIRTAKGFPIGGKVRKLDASRGIVFLHKGEQVAALLMPSQLWLRKDVSDKHKQVLGAAVLSIVAASYNSL